MPDKKAPVVQKNMTSYLEKKYEKQFIVEKPHLTGNEGTGYNTYMTYAYPKNQPSFRFHVAWDIGEPGEYDDDYLTLLWSAQGKAEIGKYLNDIYDQDILLHFKLNINNTKYKEANFSEVIKTNETREKGYFSLVYFIFIDGEINKDREAQRIYKVFEHYVSRYQPNTYAILVYFLSKDYEPEFRKIFADDERFRAEFQYDELREENKIINLVIIDNERTVNSPEDVKNRFEN